MEAEADMVEVVEVAGEVLSADVRLENGTTFNRRLRLTGSMKRNTLQFLPVAARHNEISFLLCQRSY